MIIEGAVLVAASDAVLRVSLTRHLTARGIACDAAVDANGTASRLSEKIYEMVLLELSLAGSSAAVIRQLAGLAVPLRPVVLAIATQEDLRLLDAEVVKLVLRRPFDVAAIADVIRSCAASGFGRRGVQAPPMMVPSARAREFEN